MSKKIKWLNLQIIKELDKKCSSCDHIFMLSGFFFAFNFTYSPILQDDNFHNCT
jgi:hypothetical protein